MNENYETPITGNKKKKYHFQLTDSVHQQAVWEKNAPISRMPYLEHQVSYFLR